MILGKLASVCGLSVVLDLACSLSCRRVSCRIYDEVNGNILWYVSVRSTSWMVNLKAGVDESPVTAHHKGLRLLSASRVPAFPSGFSGDTLLFDVVFLHETSAGAA